MKVLFRSIFVASLVAVLLSAGCAEKTVPVTADTIYFNGNVITLDERRVSGRSHSR